MKNINFNRIVLMMRKYLIESPTRFYWILAFVTFFIILTAFDSQFNEKRYIFSLGTKFTLLLLALLGVTELFMQGQKSKSNRINLLQIPATVFEKISALFILQLISTILMFFIIIANHTIRQITETPMQETLNFLDTGLFLIWANAIFTLFRLNLNKSDQYSSLITIVPLLIIITCFLRLDDYKMTSFNSALYINLFELITLLGCWYLIYRRLANSQIN
jgi:hypothetical protein